MPKIILSEKLNKNKAMKVVNELMKVVQYEIDKDMLKQITLEIIINAQKYGTGEVSVFLTENENTLLVEVENVGDFIVGKGICKKEINENKRIIKQIFTNIDSDSYGLCDIIRDIEGIGYIEIETGESKIRFYDESKITVRNSNIGKKVKIKVELSSEVKTKCD